MDKSRFQAGVDKISSRRCDMANGHVEAIHIAGSITGSRRDSTHAYMDYLSGYDQGVEDCGNGELLANVQHLQGERIELLLGDKQLIALRQVLDEVQIFKLTHKADCSCWACKAIRRFEESTQ